MERYNVIPEWEDDPYMDQECELAECFDECQKQLKRLEAVQESLLVEQFKESIDAFITDKLFAMKDIGMPANPELYDEAAWFVKRCFFMAVKEYFGENK